MRYPLPLMLLLSLASCRSVAPPGTYFDTRPAGAEVIIDGKQSGYVTPCLIALNRGSDHSVRFELPGYEMREAALDSHETKTWTVMRDGAIAPNGLSFPIGLTALELFLPRVSDDSLQPGRIFMRLSPTQK